jgi:hypothetical protein
MEKIYFENVDISYKTVNTFNNLYNEIKSEIICILIKNIKEKYSIDNIDGKLQSGESTADNNNVWESNTNYDTTDLHDK